MSEGDLPASVCLIEAGRNKWDSNAAWRRASGNHKTFAARAHGPTRPGLHNSPAVAISIGALSGANRDRTGIAPADPGISPQLGVQAAPTILYNHWQAW